MTETPAAPVFFSATLRPHRSATTRGIDIVIALIAVVSFGAGAAFVSLGAWPVTGFLGLDILLLWLALRLNHRAGNARETVEMREDALRIVRIDAWGRRKEWTFPPYWAQVVLDDERRALIVRSHGTEAAVGGFLTHGEREDLLRVLRRALGKVRETPPATDADLQVKPSTSCIE